jgi:hypothetical protein
VIGGVTYQGFMKYIVAFILCLSLLSTPAYSLDVDKGGGELPLPIFPLPVEPDYPQKPDDCDETPCQQACNQNYQACMDSADILDNYCAMRPMGPARDLCHRAAQLLRNACVIARDACNSHCYELENPGDGPIPQEH